jgi:hypothetical protein
MNNLMKRKSLLTGLVLLLVLSVPPVAGAYDIPGLTGTTFNLTTATGNITTGDGNSVYMWMYGVQGGTAQYPGPTLIVNQGDTVTINLTNTLPVPTSFVVDGITVTAPTAPATALPGVLTKEVPADNGATTVGYQFSASQPGTYIYHSGTNPPLQVEMGLLGVIIVRPTGFHAVTNRIAYDDGATTDATYTHEKLLLLTDMDIRFHDAVLKGNLTNIDFTDYHDVYWFINGRTLPDTLSAAGAPWLKHQPYDALVLMNPGQKVLYRMANASRDPHPMHTHGNHHRVIGRQGRFMSTAAAAGADLSNEVFTSVVYPGDTVDGIMTWTGINVGWDIYGDPAIDPNLAHSCNPDANGFDPVSKEWCADHGKPFPVILPGAQDLTFGQFYGGSPFLGAFGALPPGEGGFNPYGGFFFMQHSHNEKELTNNNIFPGGMATFLIVISPLTLNVQ